LSGAQRNDFIMCGGPLRPNGQPDDVESGKCLKIIETVWKMQIQLILSPPVRIK